MIAEAKAGRPASLWEITILVHLRKDGGEPTLAELRVLLQGMEREGLIEHETEARASSSSAVTIRRSSGYGITRLRSLGVLP